MKKKIVPDKIDQENQEWTEKDFKKAKSASEVLPSELLAVLPKRKQGERGKQVAPTKEKVTIRLDADIIIFFKSQGRGWQTNLNSALKEWVKNAEKSDHKKEVEGD